MKFRTLKSLIYNTGFALATASLLQACHHRNETVNISTISASLISDDKVTISNKETSVHPAVQRSLEEFIMDHISYPPAAMIHRVQGTVYVRFTIGDDGTVEEVSTIGNRLGYGLEEEAISVVKDIPEWILINLKGERSKRILPIVFKISDEGNILKV